MPFPGTGQALSEILFEYNSRIKQERLNNFLEIPPCKY